KNRCCRWSCHLGILRDRLTDRVIARSLFHELSVCLRSLPVSGCCIGFDRSSPHLEYDIA
ncbi:unnamed protein product, partial [Musa acuminata subsp. burmannicoides]